VIGARRIARGAAGGYDVVMVRRSRVSAVVLAMVVAGCSSRDGKPPAGEDKAGAATTTSSPSTAAGAAPAAGVATPTPPAPAPAAAGLDGGTSAAAPSPEAAALVARARAIPASQLLAPPKPIAGAQVPLAGTIEDYVRAVAATNGVGTALPPELVACPGDKGDRCVKIVGEPCPPSRPGEHVGDCEGMSLSVVIDMTTEPPSLASAEGGMGPVRNQEDIEQQLGDAP
jgi:hypothetical protein